MFPLTSWYLTFAASSTKRDEISKVFHVKAPSAPRICVVKNKRKKVLIRNIVGVRSVCQRSYCAVWRVNPWLRFPSFYRQWSQPIIYSPSPVHPLLNWLARVLGGKWSIFPCHLMPIVVCYPALRSLSCCWFSIVNKTLRAIISLL